MIMIRYIVAKKFLVITMVINAILRIQPLLMMNNYDDADVNYDNDNFLRCEVLNCNETQLFVGLV